MIIYKMREILRCVQNDTFESCHSERSEESPAPIRPSDPTPHRSNLPVDHRCNGKTGVFNGSHPI